MKEITLKTRLEITSFTAFTSILALGFVRRITRNPQSFIKEEKDIIKRYYQFES